MASTATNWKPALKPRQIVGSIDAITHGMFKRTLGMHPREVDVKLMRVYKPKSRIEHIRNVAAYIADHFLGESVSPRKVAKASLRPSTIKRFGKKL